MNRTEIVIVTLIAVLLSFVPHKARSDPLFVLTFEACKGTHCQHYELDAPDLMSCSIFGQHAAADFLRQRGRGDWTLQRGWKCINGIPS